MAKRKKRRKWLDDDHYIYYRGGKYVREKIANVDESDCEEYRIKDLPKPGRKLLVCITKKEGPRGGKTKAVAILRSLRTKPKDLDDRRAIEKAKKIVKEREKKKD